MRFLLVWYGICTYVYLLKAQMSCKTYYKYTMQSEITFLVFH